MFRCFLNLLKHNTFSSEILHSRNGIFVTAIKCRSTQPSFDSLNDEQKEKIIKAEVSQSFYFSIKTESTKLVQFKYF